MTVVRARPRRLRLICWAAAAVVVIFGALAAAFSGTSGGANDFRSGDRAALFGVGVVLALGILMLPRSRLEADEQHIRVRNIIGSYDLTWDLIRSVGFTKGSPFAHLELANDERIPVMAVHSLDKEYALEALTSMRELLAQSRRPPP